MSCLFCSIIEGTIPSSKIYEDEYCYAFLDIAPMAPIHCLVIPKIHIESANDINESNSIYVSKIFEAIPKIARSLNLDDGYRVITNIGENGCQTVKHLHYHILGGKKLPDNIV